jgi:hypothetical protein
MNGEMISKTETTGGGVPKGAKILRKETRTTVRKIENGFIVSKNIEVRYQVGKDNTDWHHETKEWFSAKDPMKITISKNSLEDFD